MLPRDANTARFDLTWPTLGYHPNSERRALNVLMRRGEYCSYQKCRCAAHVRMIMVPVCWSNIGHPIHPHLNLVRPFFSHFAPHSAARQTEIRSELAGLMEFEAGLSLRQAMLNQSALQRHGTLQRNGDKLWREYHQNNVGVLDLSAKYGHPPCAVMRVLLEKKGLDKGQIKRALRAPDSLLDPRDLAEFRLAESFDNVTSVDQKECAARAEEFERCQPFTARMCHGPC